MIWELASAKRQQHSPTEGRNIHIQILPKREANSRYIYIYIEINML